MPALRTAAPMRASVSTVVMLILAVLGQSCGPGETEFDRSALYTPEALAGELILRYRQLNPDAKAAAVRYRSREDRKAAELRASRGEQAKTKTIGGPPAGKKQAGEPTVDDVLADIDEKLDLMQGQGIPRDLACQRMAETISGDASLSAEDKKRLGELIGKLRGTP